LKRAEIVGNDVSRRIGHARLTVRLSAHNLPQVLTG
jgi:hypothetical protein